MDGDNHTDPLITDYRLSGCGNSSKKDVKMIKTHIFSWKTTKKYQKSICNYKVIFFIMNSPPTDPWCNMLKTLEIQRKFRW